MSFVSEKNQKVIVIVSIFVILLSATLIFHNMNGSQRPMRTPRHEALAERLATETAMLINQQGQILFLDAEIRQANSPAGIERRAYFIKKITHSGKIQIVGVENAVPDITMGHGDRGISAQQFFELLKKYPNIDAIVSLVGPPDLSAEQIGRLPAKSPKLIVVSGQNKQLRPYLETDLVQTAIVPRFTPLGQREKDPKTKDDWFNRFHQVVTATNAAALPY